MPTPIPDNLSMTEAIVVILKEQPGIPMTARELATALLERRPEWYRRKRERSQQVFADDDAFRQQVVAEIGSQKPSLMRLCPQVRTTATRPRGYVYLEGAYLARFAGPEPTKSPNPLNRLAP